jgi:transposase
MKAYSQDLRERVLRAVDQGIARSEIVRVLGVSLSTIGRYLKQRRETGHVRPKAIPGRPSKKIKPLQAGLQAQLEAFPDATLAQHCQYWAQSQGMQVSRWSMSRAIKRLDLTRKKRRLGPRNAMKRHEQPIESISSSSMPSRSS